MENTLTIFKNHTKKIYCINKDCALFSIVNCQSITVPECMIDTEISYAEEKCYRYVSCNEFYDEIR